MAETSTVARPYAKAAFEFAQAQGALDAWSGMLASAAQVATNDAMLADVHLVASHVKSGRLRVLAVTGAERSPVMPTVPSEPSEPM